MVASIIVLCFNHEKFIQECLNGIFNQSTIYDYEIIICDDGSLDGSKKIIESSISGKTNCKFFDLEKNIGAHESFKLLFTNTKGKYIFICEGDDYWIDNTKVQTQLDFMLNNAEYNLSFTDALVSVNNSLSKIVVPDSIQKDYFLGLFNYKYIQTATMCFKKVSFESYIELDLKNIDALDWLIAIGCSSKNRKIGHIKTTTAVYRVHNSSFWSSTSRNIQLRRSISSLIQINKILDDKFENLTNASLSAMYLNLFRENEGAVKKINTYFNTLYYSLLGNQIINIIMLHKILLKGLFKN